MCLEIVLHVHSRYLDSDMKKIMLSGLRTGNLHSFFILQKKREFEVGIKSIQQNLAMAGESLNKANIKGLIFEGLENPKSIVLFRSKSRPKEYQTRHLKCECKFFRTRHYMHAQTTKEILVLRHIRQRIVANFEPCPWNGQKNTRILQEQHFISVSIVHQCNFLRQFFFTINCLLKTVLAVFSLTFLGLHFAILEWYIIYRQAELYYMYSITTQYILYIFYSC